MGKIKPFFIVATLLTLISCAYTKGIAVVNTTKQPVEATIIFSNTNISPIRLVVSGNSDDVVMYDVNSQSSDLLSLGLKEIILTNKSCTARISRADVEKKIKKKGLWKVIVDDATFDCDTTP